MGCTASSLNHGAVVAPEARTDPKQRFIKKKTHVLPEQATSSKPPEAHSTMDTLETGTKMYMSLYPERSTDGIIHLGNVVPNFSADTTQGPMESFHAWKAGKWAILLSHPADFSPVCTSEVCNLASRYDEITGMNCLIATLSADPVTTHNKWLSDVEAIGDAPMKVKFPIIADENRNIAHAYAMIDPWSSTERNGQVPIRAAAIINPENRLMLRFNYPASVGRNMDKIVRCLKALQLSYEKSIATPANWPLNHSHLKLEDGSYTDEYKGSVYLLPTVSDEDAKKSYPKFHTCDVPSKIPYLRLVKLEDLGDGPALNVTSSLRCPANALMERAPMTLTPKLSLEQESGKTKPRNLYPEKSSDDILYLGNVVPDFAADTTQGRFGSFHQWKAGKWAILFSHPADFTPVCTSEICSLASKYDELANNLNCVVATLSVDGVKSHDKWLEDVVAHCDNAIDIQFPIIADKNRDIAVAYNMIDPWSSDTQSLPLTIRAVFIINPENRLELSFNYPACVGRNMNEIVRCVKALQLGYASKRSIATPANWPLNHSKVQLDDGSCTDEYQGSVYLLPTVSEEDAKKSYPNFHTCDVPSQMSYLRMVKLDDVLEA